MCLKKTLLEFVGTEQVTAALFKDARKAYPEKQNAAAILLATAL